MSKPLLSLSLDMDNQWSYMKIHGEEGWEDYPSYLDIFVPHVLEILDELDLKTTKWFSWARFQLEQYFIRGFRRKRL